MDSQGFRDEEVGENDEREREEEDEATEEATGFNGDKHEIRERASRDEKRSVKISRDRSV